MPEGRKRKSPETHNLNRNILASIPKSPASGSKTIYWDKKRTGLGAYRTSRDQISFVFQYRSPIDKLLCFVRDALDAAWGDEWIMHVPSEARGRMRRRQRQAEERGRPADHLIVHADFGDWIQIIGREENWPLFVATFGSLDVLRETLEQIRPIRHDASHPRGVGPEDLLVLAANGTRLMRWIGPA